MAEVFSEIESWTPSFGLELAREVGNSTAVSAGYALGFFASSATIPNPESMGPVYRMLIAPELSLYATGSRPNRLAFAARRRLTAESAVLVRAERESAAPHNVEQALAFAPGGSRALWRLSLSVMLTE